MPRRTSDTAMIHLTRINHSPLILNPDLIELIQATPDTLISLTTGRNYVVLDSPEDVIDRIVAFRQRVAAVQNTFTESRKSASEQAA